MRRLKVYVRYDATIDNTGGGGKTNALPNNAAIERGALVSSDTTAPTGPFAATVVGALAANRPFLDASSGFVGTPSDGLSQLDSNHRLRDDYGFTAMAGNVVQTARIDRPSRPLTLALGFGPHRRRGGRYRPAQRGDLEYNTVRSRVSRWLARLLTRRSTDPRRAMPFPTGCRPT